MGAKDQLGGLLEGGSWQEGNVEAGSRLVRRSSLASCWRVGVSRERGSRRAM